MSRYAVVAVLTFGTLTTTACSSGSDGAAPTLGGDTGDSGAPTLDAALDGGADGDAANADAGPPPPEAAGSRIKPSYRVTKSADGASFQYFVGWQDTARSEHCFARRLSDGKSYCAPLGRAIEFEDKDTYFLDAQCAVPLAGIRKVPPSCAGDFGDADQAKYVTRNEQTPQCSSTRIFTPPVTSPSVPTTIYAKNGSTCTGQSANYFTTEWDLYPKSALASLAEIVPSAFVEFTRTEESTVQANDRATVGSRVHPQVVKMQGADGSYSRGVQRLIDYSRSEFCHPSALADGKLHCAPGGSWFYDESYYLDSSCSMPGIEVDGRVGPVCDRDDRAGKYLMSQENVMGCGVTHLFPFPTGSSYSELYYKYGTTCSDNGPAASGGYLLFPKTQMTEIPASTFVDFTATYVEGSARGTPGTRLVPMSLKYAGADGSSWTLDAGLFQDKQSQSICSETVLSDGQIHCVPPYTSVLLDVESNYFADAACTQPIVGVGKASSCALSAPRPTLMAKRLQVNGCYGVKLLPLPTSVLGVSSLYWKNGQSCVQDTSNGPNYIRSYDFYPASATQVANVDPSSFPTLAVTTSR